MKIIAKKFKSYTSSVSIVNNNNMEKRLLNILMISFGFLAFIYVAFLGNMVFNIVERKSLEADIRNLNNTVGDLEGEYLALSNKVDLAFSYSLGFREAQTKFAIRKTLGSLKLANNEI